VLVLGSFPVVGCCGGAGVVQVDCSLLLADGQCPLWLLSADVLTAVGAVCRLYPVESSGAVCEWHSCQSLLVWKSSEAEVNYLSTDTGLYLASLCSPQ